MEERLLDEALTSSFLRGLMLGVFVGFIVYTYTQGRRSVDGKPYKPWWVDLGITREHALKMMDEFWKTRATEKAAT